MTHLKHVFISYSRTDLNSVQEVVNELNKLGVKTWMDTQELVAEINWADEIQSALKKSVALIVFLSENSMKSKFVLSEIGHLYKRGSIVIPILLKSSDRDSIPYFLDRYQYIEAEKYPQPGRSVQIAQEIYLALKDIETESLFYDIDVAHQGGVARALAAQSREISEINPDNKGYPPDSLFIIHGHDEEFLLDVEFFIYNLKIRTIIMKNVGGASTSLIPKFFEIAGKSRYAIALISGDDYGAPLEQYEDFGAGEKSLQYRARQNVILELGFFYGLLGWENVFVLERAPKKVFPNFERPSDLNGVVFDKYDSSGKWRSELHRRLSTHGFLVPPLSTEMN